jgi:hypothetical protein
VEPLPVDLVVPAVEDDEVEVAVAVLHAAGFL